MLYGITQVTVLNMTDEWSVWCDLSSLPADPPEMREVCHRCR